MKDDPKVVRAGPWGGLAWRAVLEMTKALDWGGVIPAGEVDGLLLARHLGWTGNEVVLVDRDQGGRTELRIRDLLQGGLEACGRVGLLVPLEDGHLGIPRWEDMQPDPGSARRVAKFRKKRKALLQAKMGGGGVTVTPTRGGVRVTSGGNGDGTTATTEATAPPTTEEEALRAPEAARSGKGKKRVDRSTPVERLLRGRGITLSDRGGCGVNAWRKQLRAAAKAGAPDEEVAAAIEASSPLDKPWDALQPITNRYGRHSRRDPRGFRIPAGAPKPPPGESFGEGKKARNDEGPMEDL